MKRCTATTTLERIFSKRENILKADAYPAVLSAPWKNTETQYAHPQRLAPVHRSRKSSQVLALGRSTAREVAAFERRCAELELRAHNAEPSPATHAILTLLEAGDAVY